MIHPIVAEKLPQLRELCKKHRVETLYLFGSATTDTFDEKNSDVDLLYRFMDGMPVIEYGENFFELAYALRDLFGRKVDMVSEKALHNPYFIQELDQTKQLIYGNA